MIVIILLNHSCWEFTAEGNYIEVSVLSDLHVPMTLKAVTVRLSEPDLDHFHGAEDCIKHISLKNIKLITPSLWISKIFYRTIFIFNVFLFKKICTIISPSLSRTESKIPCSPTSTWEIQNVASFGAVRCLSASEGGQRPGWVSCFLRPMFLGSPGTHSPWALLEVQSGGREDTWVKGAVPFRARDCPEQMLTAQPTPGEPAFFFPWICSSDSSQLVVPNSRAHCVILLFSWFNAIVWNMESKYFWHYKLVVSEETYGSLQNPS